jgi:hypothetical protein
MCISHTGTKFSPEKFVHRIRLSEFELMEWYGKRAHVRIRVIVEYGRGCNRRPTPHMNSSAPRPVENNSSDDEWQDMEQEQPPVQEHDDDQHMDVQVHPNTIILPVETRSIEELRAGARR